MSTELDFSAFENLPLEDEIEEAQPQNELGGVSGVNQQEVNEAGQVSGGLDFSAFTNDAEKVPEAVDGPFMERPSFTDFVKANALLGVTATVDPSSMLESVQSIIPSASVSEENRITVPDGKGGMTPMDDIDGFLADTAEVIGATLKPTVELAGDIIGGVAGLATTRTPAGVAAGEIFGSIYGGQLFDQLYRSLGGKDSRELTDVIDNIGVEATLQTVLPASQRLLLKGGKGVMGSAEKLLSGSRSYIAGFMKKFGLLDDSSKGLVLGTLEKIKNKPQQIKTEKIVDDLVKGGLSRPEAVELIHNDKDVIKLIKSSGGIDKGLIDLQSDVNANLRSLSPSNFDSEEVVGGKISKALKESAKRESLIQSKIRKRVSEGVGKTEVEISDISNFIESRKNELSLTPGADTLLSNPAFRRISKDLNTVDKFKSAAPKNKGITANMTGSQIIDFLSTGKIPSRKEVKFTFDDLSNIYKSAQSSLNDNAFQGLKPGDERLIPLIRIKEMAGSKLDNLLKEKFPEKFKLKKLADKMWADHYERINKGLSSLSSKGVTPESIVSKVLRESGKGGTIIKNTKKAVESVDKKIWPEFVSTVLAGLGGMEKRNGGVSKFMDPKKFIKNYSNLSLEAKKELFSHKPGLEGSLNKLSERMALLKNISNGVDLSKNDVSAKAILGSVLKAIGGGPVRGAALISGRLLQSKAFVDFLSDSIDSSKFKIKASASGGLSINPIGQSLTTKSQIKRLQNIALKNEFIRDDINTIINSIVDSDSDERLKNIKFKKIETPFESDLKIGLNRKKTNRQFRAQRQAEMMGTRG